MHDTIKMGSICFEHTAKELVQITNGTDKGGVFVPTEAIALRVVGYRKLKPSIAFTYRGVLPENLSLAEGGRTAFEGALAAAGATVCYCPGCQTVRH